MTLNEFIFSEKLFHRLTRHLLFWSIYITYFFILSFPLRDLNAFTLSSTYYIAFLNVRCFAPVAIMAAYFFMYYLLPHTLPKKKYWQLAGGVLMVYILGILINYFTAGIFFQNTPKSFALESNFQHRIEFATHNTRWGMIIAIIALGIKLAKNWELQQKENLQMLRKKHSAEIQLQKARIHPDFLFRSLNIIKSYIQSGSNDSNSMILNLSDLLSYSLYESDRKFVPLEKELLELEHLISLEEAQQENLIDIRVQTNGDVGNKYIAGMLIVKVVEEAISLFRNIEDFYCLVNLSFNISDHNLTVHISFIKLTENYSCIQEIDLLIINLKKRLSESYSANDYKVELSAPNQNTIILKLKLISEQVHAEMA